MPLDSSTTLPEDFPNFSFERYLSLYNSAQYSNNLVLSLENMERNGFSESDLLNFKCMLHMQIYAFTQQISDNDINSRFTGISNIDYNRGNKLITFDRLGKQFSIQLYIGDSIPNNIVQIKNMVANIREGKASDYTIAQGLNNSVKRDSVVIITSSTGVTSF